ncbi:MAG: AIR synthase related protein, partial [Armatimonadota bacterium]
MSHTLPVGKLNIELLRDLLARHPCHDPRVLAGPGIGEDVAVVELEDRCLVLKTDPITFATDEIGWYAVHVNANDIATSGAAPRWFLATLLLPEELTTEP